MEYEKSELRFVLSDQKCLLEDILGLKYRYLEETSVTRKIPFSWTWKIEYENSELIFVFGNQKYPLEDILGLKYQYLKKNLSYWENSHFSATEDGI